MNYVNGHHLVSQKNRNKLPVGRDNFVSQWQYPNDFNTHGRECQECKGETWHIHAQARAYSMGTCSGYTNRIHTASQHEHIHTDECVHVNFSTRRYSWHWRNVLSTAATTTSGPNRDRRTEPNTSRTVYRCDITSPIKLASKTTCLVGRKKQFSSSLLAPRWFCERTTLQAIRQPPCVYLSPRWKYQLNKLR